MKTIMLSIKPEYAEKILNGEKKLEFRKTRPAGDVRRILIYETRPIRWVVGFADVVAMFDAGVRDIMKNMWKGYGISAEKLAQYYRGLRIGTVYRLGKTFRFHESRPLSFYGLSRAPQNLVYIEEDKDV